MCCVVNVLKMCRPMVFILFIAILHNEIRKTYQSKIESSVPSNTTNTSDIVSLISDEFAGKPKDALKKNEDTNKSTNSSDVADTISNDNKHSNVTIPIVPINNNKVVPHTNYTHEIISNKQSIAESNNSLKEVMNSANNANDNSSNHYKNVQSDHKVIGNLVTDVPGGSFSKFPTMSYIQRLAGRMIIPMLKVHQKFSGGLSKGVHGVQEVGSGTVDIAQGTFNIFKDAARSIFNIQL